MADELYAGTNGAFNGSMAEAMEQAMDALLFADKGIHLPAADTEERKDRRRLFIAIAAGVINHLAARDGAIQVTVHHGSSDETVGSVVHVQAAPPASPGAP